MMITVSNDTKSIQISLSNTINENSKGEFTIELPKVVCNNREDAEYIQQKVNTYIVNGLAKELIKGD